MFDNVDNYDVSRLRVKEQRIRVNYISLAVLHLQHLTNFEGAMPRDGEMGYAERLSLVLFLLIPL